MEEANLGDFESFDRRFINLSKKVVELLPLIQEYNLKDLATAIFAITSWRDNRSAQESCLALNRSLVECSSFGNQPIETYENFVSFFQSIDSILKTTYLDDTVINDFGEIHICFDNRFYPVITGTGHTGSVYGVLQYLDSLSQELKQHAQTQSVLEYQKYMISSLKEHNLSQYDNLPIAFDIPMKEYFNAVKNYMRLDQISMLDMEIIQASSNPNQPIVKTHFVHKGKEIFPLFNPSLMLDYYINLLKNASQKNIKGHIHSTLHQKIESIHLSFSEKVPDALIYDAKVAINEKLSPLKEVTLLYAQEKTIILFIDVDEMESYEIEKYINELKSKHKENELGFVDFNCPVGKGKYFGIKVPSNQDLEIILFNHYTNLDMTYMQLGDEKDQTIFTAVDLMVLLMMAEDIDEIIDFMKYRTDEQSRVFSWGGISDFFTLWKQEKGYISKGAIEYNLINISFETSAAYIIDLYKQWQKCFPFHLIDMSMGFPEQWKISLDENDVYQFARKGMNPLGGAGFLFGNGGFIFCSYDFLGIMQNQDIQNVRSWRDLVSGLNERFVLEFQTQLNKIDLLRNVFINIQCNSLNNVHENKNYVQTDLLESKSNKWELHYTVDTLKLMKDISNSENRRIESQYLLELLDPLLKKYPLPLQAIKEIIENNAAKDKTADVMLKKLDYYMNPDCLTLRLTDAALLAARKTFAKIAAESGVQPGKYTRKEATKVVRKMQESLVRYFESQILYFDRVTMHSVLLHYYSSEILAGYINYVGYTLTDNIDEALQQKNKEKLVDAREKNKQMQVSLLYLIETNLFLVLNRDAKIPDNFDIENLAAFSHWLGILQSHSDMCFHTTSDTHFIILDDYRVNVELGEEYQDKIDTIKKRNYESEIYAVQGDEIDKEYFEKVAEGFLLDTGVDFRVLESVLKQLMECSFPKEQVEFEEIRPNVIHVNKADAIKDYSIFVEKSVPLQMVQKAYDFLTLSPDRLKTINDQQHNILPVWERRERNERFDVKPLLSVDDSYIYSPIVIHELYSRWTHGWLQFYPPYEIGLDNALKALWSWKERYEKLFSTDVRDAFREKNYTYAAANIEINRADRKGNHPKDLGDYDVIALSKEDKKLFILECKVLQPVGSVFEHSMQQKGFFLQNRYDEKFQKRIDYLKCNYRTFFNNIGYDLGDEEYTIKSYMVVNKVFDAYYKKIDFSIITFDELKEMI